VLLLLPLEGSRESLLSQVAVPQLGKALVFGVKLGLADVLVVSDKAMTLLNTVAHGVAILFAVLG
jgi:hypothetical protein